MIEMTVLETHVDGSHTYKVGEIRKVETQSQAERLENRKLCAFRSGPRANLEGKAIGGDRPGNKPGQTMSQAPETPKLEEEADGEDDDSGAGLRSSRGKKKA